MAKEVRKNKTNIMFFVDKDLKKVFARKCFEEDTNMSKVLTEAILFYLKTSSKTEQNN